MRALSRILLALGLVGTCSTAPSSGAPPTLLAETQLVALPGVARRIDHLAIDPAGKRLFVAALGNHSLEVLDLKAGKRISSIAALKEPQGVAYLPLSHRVVVAMRGGEVAAFDDASYQRTATMPNMGDADNLRYDARSGQLYLGYGEGALGVIEPTSMTLVASVSVGGHPESFRLEENGPRVFVNVPQRREILVVDRQQRSILTHIALGGLLDNYPMSLDESGHRLFVGVRQPAQLLVFDTNSGQRIAAVACAGDTDDLFYDARRQRVYVIGGEGYVDVFDALPSSKYGRLERVATRAGARTGLWSNELDRLFVAWPARNGKPAAIQVLAPPNAAPFP